MAELIFILVGGCFLCFCSYLIGHARGWSEALEEARRIIKEGNDD